GRDRAGPGVLPAGPQQRRLAPAPGDLRHDRHPDLRRGRPYDPRAFNDRMLLGLKGTMAESELHFIRARLQGGIISRARRGELILPLPIGLAYDAAGHVILDPDAAIAGAVRHLLATFEATGSATAVVKAFRAAGLSFPWRHRKGPRKGEV